MSTTLIYIYMYHHVSVSTLKCYVLLVVLCIFTFILVTDITFSCDNCNVDSFKNMTLFSMNLQVFPPKSYIYNTHYYSMQNHYTLQKPIWNLLSITGFSSHELKTARCPSPAQTFHIFIFLSRTTELITTKLDTRHPLVKVQALF